MTERFIDQRTATTFHPVVDTWFSRRYGRPTRVQEQTWNAIADGQNVLVSSPTGSGKTLAALLPCLRSVVHGGTGHDETVGVRVLYVTPLKALNNDILEHLEAYASEMQTIAQSMDFDWPGFRVAVRTGDTSKSRRNAMLTCPPHLLVTTPESLFILLTSVRGRAMLQTVERVIVDEIHDLARSPRGAHLSISLERLERHVQRPLQRIGLSATQRPLDRMARFLGGWSAPSQPRPVTIIEETSRRVCDLRVMTPPRENARGRGDSIWRPFSAVVSELVSQHRTTVVFVNSRRLCERVTHHLNDHAGYELARSHHGSVAREQRLLTEQMFKAGDVRCIVATSSLELGIDVGHVDLVIQVDSPKRVSSALQRIGRAEHRLDGVNKGTFMLKTMTDVFELAVIVRLAESGVVEEIDVVRDRLDILAQQLVSMASVEDWTEDDILDLIGRSDCYSQMDAGDVTDCLRMLSGWYGFLRPLVTWNPEHRTVTACQTSAMAALMGAGTIPASGGYPVIHQSSKIRIGELDEEYVHESRVGDVFHLGASAWRIAGISHQAVYVTETRQVFGEVPFWRGEQDGRSYAVGQEVGQFLHEVSQRLRQRQGDSTSTRGVRDWLEQVYHLDAAAASYVIDTIAGQHAAAVVPTHHQLVVEVFQDEHRHTHVLIHCCLGARFNRTWLTALEAWLHEQGASHFYSHAKDDGIHFVFEVWAPAWSSMVWQVTEKNIAEYLLKAIPSTPQFAQTFRRQAETALLLSRGWTRTPTWKRRLQSDALLRDALQSAEVFPLVRTAQMACLNEGFDLVHVEQTLRAVGEGTVHIATHETTLPSPLARAFLSDYTDAKLYESDGVARDVQRLLEGLNETNLSRWFDVGDGTSNRPEHSGAEADPNDGLRLVLRSPEIWIRYLADRHHLTATRRLQGMEGLRQVIEELQGLYLPVTQWESSVFPSRIIGYRKEDLDLLCATGEVRWLGHREPGQKEGRVAFFCAGKDSLYAPSRAEPETSSHPALLRRLQEAGAMFMASIQAEMGISGKDLVRALLDLVWEGAVSNDQFAPIRHSTQRVSGKTNPLRSAIGRWYAVGVEGGGVHAKSSAATEDRFALSVRQSLRQYGLVCRGTFGDNAPLPWDAAKVVLRAFEDWGIVTRGLFIEGIPSVQFADRSFVSAILHAEPTISGVMLIPADDPANPFGTFVAWPTLPQANLARKSGNYLVLVDGRWKMWVEAGGKRITAWDMTVDEGLLKTVGTTLVKQFGLRKIEIESWNGVPIADTEAAECLKALGAERNGKKLVLWSLNFR